MCSPTETRSLERISTKKSNTSSNQKWFLFYVFLLLFSFFLFLFLFFAFFTLFFFCFYFLNTFLLSRSTQKGGSQNFTANRCKLWSTKNLDKVMKNKNSTSGSRSLSSKGNFGILIFAQPVSRTHGWMQNLILPDFKKEITLFWVRIQKLWPFEVRRSELGFWRGVAVRVFMMER